MLQAKYIPHNLKFITPGGTSRGVLTEKSSWYILISDDEDPEVVGIGECSILPNLSFDDRPDYEQKLNEVCSNINDFIIDYNTRLKDWPSMRFALEMALLDLKNGGRKLIFNSDFFHGRKSIPINGLIWMGDVDYMKLQLTQKLKEGFNCIKIKIGALDFDKEIALLKEIRDIYSSTEIEIRVDANGAFSPDEALYKMDQLYELDIHSIEQPIKAGQWNHMSQICKKSALPVALDEELIGIHDRKIKNEMLEIIHPAFIILKPSLTGGFQASEEWIDIAQELNIGWWATSALEGNIGLNAIAQWISTFNTDMPQGLGTGKVFSNNIDSPLSVEYGQLRYFQNKIWGNI